MTHTTLARARRLLSVPLSLVLIFSALPAAAFDAAAAAYSGKCGDDVSWRLDTSTGALTVSGTGKMNDYDHWNGNPVPWFDYVDSVKTITIGDGVTSVGNFSFPECVNTTSIDLPSTVKRIGQGAFYWCRSLTTLTIPEGVTTIEKGAFEGCSALKDLSLPSTVKSIGGGAFCECNSLTSVVIPEKVTRIGNYAFFTCVGLSDVQIPDNVVSIGNYAFYGCTSLTSIVIPGKVKTIGEGAFFGCSSLSSIVIPESVESIGDNVFYGCPNLDDVYYLGTPEQWDEIEIGGSNPTLTAAELHTGDLPVVVIGDVDGNEIVDATDLTVLSCHVGGICQLTAQTLLAAADVDGSGVIDASDLSDLARHVGGIG